MARGAKESGARGLSDTLDDVSTDQAGEAFAGIDMELMLEASWAALSIEIIAQSRASGFDGALDLAVDGLMKTPTFGLTDRVGEPIGCELCCMERLAGIDISETSDDFLVQKSGFDGLACGETAREDFRRERRG